MVPGFEITTERQFDMVLELEISSTINHSMKLSKRDALNLQKRYFGSFLKKKHI